MSPMVACSPPATRSGAVPIGGTARAGARVARVSDGSSGGAKPPPDASASPFRPAACFSFSTSCTTQSRSLSVASTPASGARPPSGPSAVAKAQHYGFDVKAPGSSALGFDAPPHGAARSTADSAATAAAGPLSPGRRETKPSLLSMALSVSDLPLAGGLSFAPPLELYGSASPSLGWLRDHVQDAPPPCEPDFALLNARVPQHPALDAPVVRAAYAAAWRAHAGQVRKSGEPVISHCLETAVILAELGLPEETIAAGLLHDVLCDTRTTACQLEEYVPRSCVELVEKVTRLSEVSQLYRDNAHTLEATTILDMLTSMSDVGALLVKLADRLHNMRTISALARCKQVRMASETLEVFAVLANRLGAWSVKAELEDLAFKTLHPEEYAAVSAAVAARTAAIDLPARVAQAREALAAAGLEVVDVSGRVKNAYGVWRKLKAGNLSVDRLDEVYDVAALRVVVPHKHDCYRALREVEALWAAVPGRFKDYVRNRKGNGYQSLHTSVLADGGAGGPAAALLEVQIRTPKMHYIAEYGFAAHWRYKEKLSREDLWLDRLVQWKKWVAAEKLRIRDAKVRASGSPQRDLALAALLGAPGGASDADAPAAAAPAAGDAAAEPRSERRPAAALSSSAPAGGADARFMARFSIRPISDEDLEQHAASILISGPRGVRVEGVPARCTLAQLLASGAVAESEARGCSLVLNGRPVPLLARRDVTLRPGDHVAFVREPNLVPRAPRAPALAGVGAGFGAIGRDSDDLPAFAGFAPAAAGRSAPLEAELGRALAASSARLRQAALAL